MLSKVLRRAARSSASSRRRSSSSARSGASTSRTLRPSTRSRGGSKWPASASRCASAFSRSSGSRSSGSSSSACTITRACPRVTSPAASADRTCRHRIVSASASRSAAIASPRPLRVWCASHAPGDRAPASSATSSAHASTRSRSSCSRSSARASRTSAAALSGMGRYSGSTLATSSSAEAMRSAHRSSGCSSEADASSMCPCWTGSVAVSRARSTAVDERAGITVVDRKRPAAALRTRHRRATSTQKGLAPRPTAGPSPSRRHRSSLALGPRQQQQPEEWTWRYERCAERPSSSRTRETTCSSVSPRWSST